MSDKQVRGKYTQEFKLEADPRMMRTQRHELLDILVIALCAIIGGADHWTEVVEFGQVKQPWFAGFLRLSNGIPSHDTFARVFRLINTEALEQTCHQWLSSVAGRVQGVVIGKELQERGIKVNTGTIVDATIIGAPSSTKNAEKSRDPEMHQTRKGQQWYFGMKCGRPHFMPNVALVHMWRPAASALGGPSLSTT